MTIEQRIAELQSKAQAVADECHRLGVLIDQGVKTTDSPDFAGLTLDTPLAIASGGTGASGGSDARLNLGLEIKRAYVMKNSSGSAWWRLCSFQATSDSIPTVLEIEGFSAAAALGTRGNWKLIISATTDNNANITCARLVYSDSKTPPSQFDVRYSDGVYTVYFFIPQYTEYQLIYRNWYRAIAGFTTYDSAQSPTGTAVPLAREDNIVLLWEGTWNSGNITVQDVHKYNQLLVVTSANANVAVPMYRVPGGNLFLGDIFWGSLQYRVGFNVSTNTLAFDGCSTVGHPPSAVHTTTTNYNVTKIYGFY